MQADILLTVVMTAVVQSVFGAGVLLFGTPILLLLGHDFVEVLVVLLPISLAISILQVFSHYHEIDAAFYRRILQLTLPPIVLFLLLATQTRINIGLVIGAFLVLIALKEFSSQVAGWIDGLMRHEKLYFIIMGVVHGLSNLGGSMLTALVHYKHYGKDQARMTIAAAYGSFAVIQLLTLALSGRALGELPLAENGSYLVLASLT